MAGVIVITLSLIFLNSLLVAETHLEPVAPDILDSFDKILDHMAKGTENQENIKYTLDEVLKEVRHSDLKSQVEDLRKQISILERNIQGNKVDLDNVRRQTSQASGDAGLTYSRWGKTSCPGNGTVTIYEGFASGGFYTHTGASPEMICLPRDPEWGHFKDGSDTHSNFIYIAEYEVPEGRDRTLFGKSVHQQDVPCAVCEVRNRKAHLMIPGRKSCYDGWTREYWGYLMSSRYNHKQQMNFYCVDKEPELLTGGGEDTNGYILYFVEIRSGGNIFPPYVDGRELPCVVCTK